MHYINQCLNPKRILNYKSDIEKKCKTINNLINPKQAGMIELQLTDKCNLNCFHCHFRNMGDVFFNISWIDRINDDISPKAISLAGGGEPTLYPDFGKTIRRLKNGKSNPQIGLITNGVYIPSGEWLPFLSWLRVSLYSINKNKYSGKDVSIQKIVLRNIEKYMNMDNLHMLGVSLLYYNGNVMDCIRLSLVLFRMLKKSNRCIDRFNIQFKRAFGLCDPRNIDNISYKNDLSMIPSVDELNNAIEYKKKLCNEEKDFELFLNLCTNYNQIESFWISRRDIAISQSNPNVTLPKNFTNCYVVLENRLITPDGFVYPCPSIAENRFSTLALGHILDDNDVYKKNILNYYSCNSEWCNKRFCRHSSHNKLLMEHMNGNSDCKFENELQEDYFF